MRIYIYINTYTREASIYGHHWKPTIRRQSRALTIQWIREKPWVSEDGIWFKTFFLTWHIYIQEVGIWQRGKICLSPNHCLKFLTPQCRRYVAEILSIRRETRYYQSIYLSSAVCIGTPLKVFPYLNESIRDFRAFLNESNFKMFPVRINFFFVKIRNKSITKKLSGKP